MTTDAKPDTGSTIDEINHGRPSPDKSPGRAITILGLGPSAKERRYDILRYIAETEIWTLNNAYHAFSHIESHISRWFEIHSWEYLRSWKAGVPCHFERLEALPCPIYVTEPIPKVRNQHIVPWVKIFSHFTGSPSAPGTAANYALGSPSYMLALALYEHDQGDTISYIQSYGIDTSDERHKQQRQSWAYWVSQAHVRGIELGGTMTDFFTECEMDEGLRGLREAIGDAITKKSGWETADQDKGD
jgi:hypothetical protein